MLVYQRVTGVVTHMAPLVIQLLCQAVVRSQEIAPHDAVQCPKQPGVIGRHQKCREGTQKGDVVVKYVDDVGGVDGHRTGFWKGKHVLWRCFFWGRMAFSGRDDGDDACLELVQWWLIPFGPSGWVCDEHPQLPNMNAQPILNPETMGSQFFVFQSPTQLNWIVTLVTLSRPCSGFLSKNWRHVTCAWPLPTRWGPRGEVKNPFADESLNDAEQSGELQNIQETIRATSEPRFGNTSNGWERRENRGKCWKFPLEIVSLFLQFPLMFNNPRFCSVKFHWSLLNFYEIIYIYIILIYCVMFLAKLQKNLELTIGVQNECDPTTFADPAQKSNVLNRMLFLAFCFQSFRILVSYCFFGWIRGNLNMGYGAKEF